MVDAAPFYSAVEDAIRAESAAWARFSAAKDSAEFCASWLTILCLQIERVGGGLLLLGPNAEGAYTPAALWPHAGRDLQHLSPAAERALSERRGVVIPAGGGSVPAFDQRAFVGYPIEVAGVLHGAVVLELAAGSDKALQRALRTLHWASAWLVDQFRQRTLEERDARLARMALAMGLVATAMNERRFAASALAVSNELAGALQCDRVSIGLEKSGSVEVRAISNTATFDPKMDLGRRIGTAMDEVLDLDVTIVYPAIDEVGSAATAHAELARQLGDVAVCSVPLLDNGNVIGVATFERGSGEPFDAETVELCKTVGGLLGPILELKLGAERGLLRHAGEKLHRFLQILFGPRHPGAKLIALTIVGVLLFFNFATGTYRISAKTVVEGAVQRAAAAPFDGYLVESFVRAGDAVRAGQVLCRLDDRDLKLERIKLMSEREQLTRRHRQALAAQERSTMAIVSAQIDQAEAALTLVSDKLARATLIAPFDGVVVSGDLRQLLGSPVELGKLLFQIAPLDSYRIILQVEERDIAYVVVGQSGELTLSGILSERMDFTIEQIMPVSTAQEGRNVFRVEARLQSPSERVRPGMEGIGKIIVGERNLFWIWTHRLMDWLILTAWKWQP
ncbi:HlyD family efflux transporter periplasmic adaptor subunit [Bradyrhizobium sp. cf659]|uniref:HlyD family efflux transporter periplasmic adaptor subunit n=1 Tax=Bradyrhizobium sp. cf659 TaxID=1761771 RepID=UPI0008EDD228|nr:HlyD family efflux transporter periplasmic adaptor subunit [Bradyrhizobium sp. cf659]SFI60239.1 Multidrug efflux pump subunit AcrA (membrane-fusion protein) [Bradyrhizobium sp. cf659]